MDHTTKNRSLNILWHSNATWVPTGYGQQTRLWTWALKELGYGTVVSAYYGLGGSPLADSKGVHHLPQVRDQFNNDMIAGYFNLAAMYYPNHKKTDLIWSLIDIFAMNSALSVWESMPWAAWCPIDCEPVLMNERDAFDVCRYPIAMSRHGEAEMKKIGLKPYYVPHGIRTDIFKPTDRVQARRNMFTNHLINRPIPDDAFLVVIVGNNGMDDRKNWSGMLEAFQLFSNAHEDALLYIHAEPEGIHGKPLMLMAEQLAIADKVLVPQSLAMAAGIPGDSHLVDIYNAADVKLMLSMGEGFGLTDVEGQACGVPIIGTNFSASIELNFTGWKVGGPARQMRVMSYQMIPDSFEAADRLEDAYRLWKNGGMPELRARTRQAALAYDIINVMDNYMLPTLDAIAADLKAVSHTSWMHKQRAYVAKRDAHLYPEKPVSRQVRRAAERKAKGKA